MYNAGFYCAIIPLALILCIISLFLTFWIDKVIKYNKITIFLYL